MKNQEPAIQFITAEEAAQGVQGTVVQFEEGPNGDLAMTVRIDDILDAVPTQMLHDALRRRRERH